MSLPNQPRGAAAGESRRQPRFRSRALTDGDVCDADDRKERAFLGTTLNLSRGGALVRTYEALQLGERIGLKVRLPEGDLAVGGEILHVVEDAIGCRLAGVRFDRLGEGATALLERHLAACAAQSAPDGWPAEVSVRSA